MMLRRRMLHLSQTAARGGWTPARLTTYAWYDPSDLSTLWQDTARTIPVTATGQTVACIDDKSGAGRHLKQATVSQQAIYRDAGGLRYLELDGVDDLYVADGTFTWGTVDHLMALRTSDTIFYVWHNAARTRIITLAQASASAPHGSVGSPTHRVNGQAATITTRQMMLDALATGTDKLLTVQGLSLSTMTDMDFGNPGTVSARYAGRLYGALFCGALTTDDRARAETWLGAKAGLTL